jgi:hypothetical protein
MTTDRYVIRTACFYAADVFLGGDKGYLPLSVSFRPQMAFWTITASQGDCVVRRQTWP